MLRGFSETSVMGRQVYTLTEETGQDYWEVEALFDLCFAPGREALSSYRLRDGVKPVAKLCLVARDEFGSVGGAIRYWPVHIERQPALLLGPVAVHPTRAGEGLGGALIRDSIALAKTAQNADGPVWKRVILVGDAPYYQRFGFRHLEGVHMPPPTNPERVLGLELCENAWRNVSGQVRPAFSEAQENS